MTIIGSLGVVVVLWLHFSQVQHNEVLHSMVRVMVIR